MLNTFGLVVGFFTCYGTRNLASSLEWRLPFALLAAYSFVFAAASLVWLPESPRWLTLRGREAEASKAWDTLEVKSADREKVSFAQDRQENGVTVDPVLTSETPTELGRPDTSLSPSVSKKSGLLDAFAPDVRARTLLGLFVMGMQQMSGIDGVLYVHFPPRIEPQAHNTAVCTIAIPTRRSHLR